VAQAKLIIKLKETSYAVAIYILYVCKGIKRLLHWITFQRALGTRTVWLNGGIAAKEHIFE